MKAGTFGLAAAIGLLADSKAGAQTTYNWVGSDSVNFSDPVNWSAPPAAGGIFSFSVAGTAGTLLTNDLTAGYNLAGIVFVSGASSYTFNGNAITLTGGITNSSTSLQTINFNIATTAVQTITTTPGGGNIILGGAISGTGGGLSITGGGTVTLTGINTYTGATSIGSGSLIIGGSGQLGAGNYAGGIAITSGTLNYASSANQTFSGIISGAGSLIQSGTGTLTLSGVNTFSGGLQIQSGAVATTTSASALGAGGVTFGVSGGSSSTILNGSAFTYTNPISVASGYTGTASISTNSAAPTFSGPITLNSNNITFTDIGYNITASGGVTGTGNILINSAGAGFVTLSTTSVNNIGTISTVGVNNNANGGTTTISAPVGANVTQINNGQTGSGFTPSPLTVSGAITVGASNKVFNSTGTSLFTISGGITGTGNLTFNDNSTGAITVSTAVVNNSGTITNSGTGAGVTTFSSAIGTGTSGLVTSITENSLTSGLVASGGLVVASSGSGGTTLVNSNASGSQILNVSGATSGTGNLIINNNSSIGTAITTVGGTTGGITLAGVNNVGTLTNSGTGTGPVYITGALGTSLTAINQNSTTSALVITGGTAGSTTGTVTVANGATLQLGNQAANNLALGVGTINTSTSGTLIFAPGTSALTYSNVLTGTGSVILNGLSSAAPAGLQLGATTSTFTGTYTVNQGRLIITTATNLGVSGTDAITINGTSGATPNGGELWVNAVITIANPITINGYGASEGEGNSGAIRLGGGTLTNTITLGSNASIDPRGSTGFVTGVISGGSGAQLLIGQPINGTDAGNAGGTLTLSNTNTYSGGTLIQGATAAANAVGALGTGAITLSTTTNSGLTQSLANALTGTNSLTVNGGTAALSFANNYTGGTTVSGGVLTITGAGGIGTGAITVSGGTLNANVAGALGQVNLTQTGGTVAESVANAFQGPIALNLSGGTTNLSFANSYTGGANISGTNLTNVSAASALSGVTTVSGGGTLSSNLATGLAQGGTIAVNSGGILTSAIAGGQFQNVAVNTGGIVNPGGVGTVGTGALTITNLATNSGGILQFDAFSPSNADLLSVNGNYSFAAGTFISFTSLPTVAGTYNLIQYSGTAPTLANFTLPTAPTGSTYNLLESGGYVELQVSGSYAGGSGNWIPTTSSSFSWNSATNWSGSYVPHVAGDTANFNSTLAGAQTVTVDGSQHVGTLTLNPGGGFAYTINQGTAGSAIYLDNGASAATITNAAGNNIINAPIVLTSSNTNAAIASGTTLSLGGLVSGAGSLTVTGAGTLQFTPTATLSLTTTSLSTIATLASTAGLVVGESVTGTNIAGGTTITAINSATTITLSTAASGSGTQSVYFTLTNTFTGGLNIAGGTVAVYNTNQLGPVNGTINFTNNGTLSYTSAVSQVNSQANQVFNFGTGGGTINTPGSGTTGKVFMSSLGQFTGSGTFTKNGAADMQINGASIGFTGNIILNGLVEFQNVAGLGFGTTTGYNGGTITVNTGGELVASGANIQIFAPITLAGGTLSSNSGPALFNNTVTVTASSTLAARLFQTPASSQSFAINTLTGSGNLSIIGGSTPTNAPGMVAIGNASNYTGTITVGTNGVLGIGNSIGGNFFGSNNAISVSTVTSGIGLVSDGVASVGTSTPEIINFALPTNAINFVASNTTGYFVGRIGDTVLNNTAANKTIEITNTSGTPVALPYNGTNALYVTPVNGYGLLLAAQPALTGTTTFNVGGLTGGTQASNVIAGLQLMNLTGTNFGITKTGTGTLQLGSGNTFGFSATTAAAINITAGTVSTSADANLGASGNGITLANTTSAEFLALASFVTSRTITIGAATGSTIGVAGGSPLTPINLTLSSGLNWAATADTLTKVENGTLTLTAPSTIAGTTGTPTGATTINAGAIAITNTNQLGPVAVANNLGAALQISGGATFTQALSLSNYGIQANGALESVSGNNAWNTGVITVANTGTIGADAGTLTIGSSITLTGSLGFVGAGNIIVNTAMTGAGTVTQYGSGTVTLNATGTSYSTLSVDAGTLKLAGTATIGVGATDIDYGGTLTIDDTVTNTLNRLAAHSLVTVGGGSFNLFGSSSATSTESFLGLNTLGRGQTTLTVTPGTGQQANLILSVTGGTGFNRSEFATAVYASAAGFALATTPTAGAATINTGPLTTAASFEGASTIAGTPNIGILPYALVNNNGTVTFATSTVIGASGYLRNLTAGETVSSFTNYVNSNSASASNTLGTLAASTTLTTNNNIASSLYIGESVSAPSLTYTSTTTLTSATISVPTTTGIVVGQLVTGTGIPANEFVTAVNAAANTVTITTATGVTAGTNTLTFASMSASNYITNISGTTITLASAAYLSSTNVPLTFGTSAVNVSLAGANGPLPATILSQAINSLTLQSGASLTLSASPETLTIGSGGTQTGGLGGAILALGNNTISGGLLTAGSGATANELIVHAVGNINIGSAIIGGGGNGNNGLTKDGAGILTLSGTAFYSGQTVVSAGTLQLAAGTNTIQYVNYLNLNGSTLDLNGTSQLVEDLFSDSTVVTGLGTIGSNSNVINTSGSAATLVLKRDASRNFTGAIAGNIGLLVSGANAIWTLTQLNGYSGPTYIAGGTVDLQNAAALPNTSSLTLNGGILTLDNSGSIDLPGRISSTLPISMGNGGITYIGHTQYTSAESLGAITGTIGTNTISVTQQTTGVSSATLTLASVTRNLGTTFNFANSGGTLGTIGSNPQIFITAAPTLTNSIIGGGFTVNSTDFASYNPTYGIGALGTTGFAGYSPLLINNAAATDNVSMAGSTGVAINSQTLNSLRITGTTAINFNSASQTLTLTSGGLLATGSLTLGSTVNSGNLTTTGPELFLLGGGTSTINSAITGSIAVVRSGGTYTLAGTNTYTGGTYLDGGTLTLGNSGNVTTGLSTLGTGGIFVSSGAFTQTAGGVIPSQALTIYGSTASGASSVTLNSNLGVANSVTTLGSNTITVPTTAGIAIGQLVTGTGIPGNEYVTAVNPATNTVTITSGLGVTAGTNTMTFLVNNTLTNLTFNNTGGITAPTMTITGILNLPNGAITASSTNPASTSTITGGTIDFGNAASPTITVNPIAFNGQNVAPLQPTLAIASALQNSSNAINITGGGNLQLSGASTFSGGINLAGGTNLTIAASSTNMANGQPLSGPLGTGTFTIGANSTIYSTAGANYTVGNNIVVSGNFTIDDQIATATTLTLGTGSQTTALPAGVATTITVNAPQMTGVLNDTITGAGSTIVKAGLGILQLNNNVGAASTFSGGVVVNSGTLLATGVGASATSLGAGPVILNGGLLQLHHSGFNSSGLITYGNNVDINSSLAAAFIDINNNGANAANTIVMGALDYGTVSGTTFNSTVAGNPAPSTILNITGGNSYKLLFNSTTLTGATSGATFNVGAGLTLIINGGTATPTSGFSASNAPTNIGSGTLLLAGNNTFAAPATISGTSQAYVYAGQSTTPLGTGGITLANGSTLQINPLYSSAISTTGYTNGGLTAKYYFTGAASMQTATNFGIAPNSTLFGVQSNDAHLTQGPAIVNGAGPLSNTMATYSGLLTITTGGTYYIGGSADDQFQVVIDGQTVQGVTSTVGQALNQQALLPITLAAGTHAFTIREFNIGNGGGSYVFYSGPDTSSNGIGGTPPVSNLQTISLSNLSYATGFSAANNYQNAAILNNAITVAASAASTIDGLGTDFNYAIPNLTLNTSSTLTVANGTGTAPGSLGNGVFIVTNPLTVAGAGATINTTTGTLVLASGVSDGGLGLTKTGQGNLILGPSTGTFSGAFNINGGFVQLADPQGLTTGTTTIGVAGTTPATLDLNGIAVTTTGNIILNGGAGPAAKSSNTPAGLYNSSANTASLPVGSTLSIGAAISSVNASIGGFGAINILGTIQDSVAGSALNKVGPDTLILSNTNTFTGTFNITAGTVQLTGSNGFTSSVTNSVVVSPGATVDLNGQAVATLKPLTLAGVGLTGLNMPNQLGALINSSGTAASYAGPITLTATTGIGGPSQIAGTNGSITLSGAETGAFQITKIGANNLTLTASDAVTLVDVQAGSLTLSGAGKIAATGADFLRQGATLTLDNTATAVSNRALSTGIYLSGNLVINGNATTAVSEIITTSGSNINLSGTFANGYGGATITLNAANTAGVTIGLGSSNTSAVIFNRAAGGTLLVRGDNLGNATGSGVANIVAGSDVPGAGSAQAGQSVGQTGVWNAPNALIYPWAVADQSAAGVGTGFAGYSSYGGSSNFGTANTGGVAPISINANNFLTAAPTITAINANTATSTTITVASTSGLAVGQLVTGTGIPANDVITAITNGTTFTVSTAATVTANNTLMIYANPTTSFNNITTTASTTVTVGSTANLYVGEIVAGTTLAGVATGYIPTGDTIASITSATTFTLSTAATVGSNPLLTFGLPGYANLSLSSAATVGSASAAQEQNSIALTGGTGGLTITSGLQLASGGVLAVGTNSSSNSYTIGGTGLLTTTGLNQEIMVHTTGTATTLTINAPIYTTAGLTKADGGTLVLGSAEQYIGNTTLNGGITQLAGGNNTIFMVYSTPATAGNAGVAVTGQVLFVNNGATLDLNGTTQAVGNLASGSGTDLAGGTIINNNVGSPATLHVALNANETWAGNISNAGAGTLNFVRDGNNTLTINSPNTLSGTVTLTGGATTLTDLGAFPNISGLTVIRSALIWNDEGVQAVTNRLPSSLPITLTGGGLQFLTRSGSGSTPTAAISLGTLNLGIGESNVVISTVGQGAAASVTFAGLGTIATGATLNFGNNTLPTGTNPYYYFTSAPTLTNGMIGAWATVTSLVASTGGANLGFATYDPTAGVRVLQYQPSATFGAGVNLYLTASTTIPTPINTATTTTVNSLSLNSASLSFTNANDTLLVQSGGILLGITASESIGTTALPGQIVSGSISNGGAATNNDLYIYAPINTLTINSKIIDNGANNNVIFSAASYGANGGTVTLTNANTYGGTTYISGAQLLLNSLLGPAVPGNIVLSGGNNSSADSLVDSQTQLSFEQSNQLVNTANITMNGASRINLGSAVLGTATAPNTQTINNLTFNNDGGSNSGDGPTVFTGAGTLTIAGTLTSTNNTESFSIPTINGFIALTSGNIVVNANQYVPNQVGLAINANIAASSAAITLTGTGWLGLGGQSLSYTQPINVNTTGGGLAIASGSGGAYGVVVGSQIILSAGTTLDTRGNTATIGSLVSSSTSSVLENGLQSTAGTLVTGLDNSSGTFAGTIQSPYPLGLLSVTKIGTGNWTLTNNSTATNNGTLTISSGAVTVSGASGTLGFTTYTVETGGTLTLDNTAADGGALNNRLGSAFLTTTAATLAPTLRTLNLFGGNLTILGNSTTAVSESLGALSAGNGSILTLSAAGTAGIDATIESIANQGQPSSLLIRGDGLGTAAGANIATLKFATAGAVGTAPGIVFPANPAGANNTTIKSVRPDIVVDTSSTGLGIGFLTIDSATGLIRPLGYGPGITYASELSATFTTATAANTNVGLFTVAYGSATGNTLAAGAFSVNPTNSIGTFTLQNGGGINMAIVATNPWNASGALLGFTMSGAGILNIAGSNSITAGQLNNGSITTDFWIVGGTLTMNAVLGGGNGFVKAGGGSLIINQAQIQSSTGATNGINGGTLQLNGGANTLFVEPTATTPSANVLAVNNGTLDLFGNNQLVAGLTSTNPLPYGGGTAGSPNIIITNSSATAATFSTNAAATVFSGEFTGNLSIDKSGNNTTMTLTSPQTYTGTTTIRGGNITLRDSASIASTAGINLYFAELIVDNTGLSSSTTRIPTAAPLNLNGGALRFNATERVDTTNLGTLNLNGGSNLFFVNMYNGSGNSSSPTFNIANLVQSNNSTLNIESPYSTALGNFTGANAHVYLTELNGIPYSAAGMVNGIIAPWMVVSNTSGAFNFATYSNTAGVTIPGQNGTAGLTTATAAGAGISTNGNITATLQSIVGQTMNSLTITPGATAVVGMNGTQDQLVLVSGGLLVNTTTAAATIQGGSITAGQLNSASTLYLNALTNTTGNITTINSPIVNNGTGALSLVRSGNSTVTFTPEIVESVAFAPSAASSTSLTIPNSTGLTVGMGVSGSLIATGTTITAITGNVLTLSAATTANGTTAVTNQITFAPVVSTASATTTSGSNSVSVLAANLPTGFTPTVGMTIGSSVNIPGGTTITAVTLGTTDTFTLSQNATATASGTATLYFNPLSNTYSGTTTINAASADSTTYYTATTNLNGLPGSIVIPGNLVINGGATVTMNTNQGQIAATSNVTINGSGVLNLVGTNTLNSLTFNNIGGNATPTIAVGTLLNLTSATPITAANDNTTFTNTISGTTLNFASASGATITTSGLSPDNLIISAAITTNLIGTTTSTGQAITKAGTGSLVLPNANAASLTWVLSGGTIIVNNATALGVNATAGALTLNGNVGLMSGTAATTIALPTIFSGTTNLTLGATAAVNQITLSGAMNLNGMSPTFTVAAQATTDTITGQITGTGGFTKAGSGALTLTPGTASTFTGAVTLTGGLITLGNANGLNMSTSTPGTNLGANVTVGTTAEINIAGFAQSFGSLAGGGIVTNSPATAVALTIGTGSNTTNATFSGSLVSATAADLSIIKTGTNNETLSGQSYYTGVTTISGGTLTLANGATASNAANGLTAAQSQTLANTAITVASGQTLSISTVGANAATNNTVNVGNATTTNAGAALTLSNGSNFTFSPGDTAISIFNIIGSGTGTSFTTSSATTNLTFNIGNAGADKIVASRAAAATGGTINLNVLSGSTGIPIGVIPLITAASGFTGTATNNFTLASGSSTITIGPKVYTLTLAGAQDTATQTALLVSVAAPTNAYWAGAVDGNWNTGIATGVTNWRTDATSNIDTQAVPASTTNVYFSTTTPTAANLTTALGADFSIASLNFTATAASATIGGTNNLTIGAGGINVAAGAAAQSISSANVTLGASHTWTNASSNLLTVSGTVNLGANTLTFANTGSGNTLVSGAIGGTGGVTVNSSGSGVVQLTNAANTYSGATNVTSGTLSVNGTISNSSSVSVTSGATLTGSGTINSPTTISAGGFVSPGNGTGVLTIANNMTISGTYLFQLATAGSSAGVGTGGSSPPIASNTNHNVINVTSGTLTLTGSTVTITSLGSAGGTGLVNSNTYSWLIAATPAANDLIGLPTLGTISGADFVSAASAGNFSLSVDPNNQFLYLNYAPVPEPASLMLIGAAGLGIFGLGRKRFKRKNNPVQA